MKNERAFINGKANVEFQVTTLKLNGRDLHDVIAEALGIEDGERYKQIPCELYISVRPIKLDYTVNGEGNGNADNQ